MAIFSRPMDLLILASGQILLSAAVLGLTGPYSVIRHAITPILMGLCWSFVVLSKYQFPPPLASTLSGFIMCSLLNYVAMAFLSTWSFETRGPSSLLIKKRAKTVSPDGKAGDVAPRKRPGAALERILWGLQSLFSYRDVNTPFEVKNVPHFLSEDPSYVPTKAAFLTRSTVTLGICYLVVDLIESQPPPPNATVLFSAERLVLWGRLSQVTVPEVLTRMAASAGFWVMLSTAIAGGASAVNIVCVALHLSPVERCRPMMGPVAEAYTIRGFWGKTWHQGTRKLFTTLATFIGDEVFVFRKGSLPNTYSKIFLTFFISGLLHQAIDFAQGIPWAQSGSLRFFCIQACGIVVEDTAQFIYRWSTGAKFGDPPKLWTRLVGYVWMVFFLLFWTTPWWFYPTAVMSAGRSDAKIIPYAFSIFKTLPTH
ncbi:tat pathway signal sequence [Diplocarpon rosae]|nr:tat pathway signal sequence [Diplocarpon rosae]